MKTQPKKINTRPAQLIAGACSTLSPRSREVIRGRFGLAGQSHQTLEQIGQKYQITRERVRQIESAALNQMKKESLASFQPVSKLASTVLKEHGQVMSQKKLLEKLVNLTKGGQLDKRALVLIFKLDNSLVEIKEDEKLNRAWASIDFFRLSLHNFLFYILSKKNIS